MKRVTLVFLGLVMLAFATGCTHNPATGRSQLLLLSADEEVALGTEAMPQLIEEYGGEVPSTIEDLTSLPGVARKTANVVLGTWFGKNDGVVVDTHVGRLAHRLNLTWNSKDTKDAVKIERDLMQVIPRKDWTYVSHALIWHGRRVCAARSPRCDDCGLARWCPSAVAA